MKSIGLILAVLLLTFATATSQNLLSGPESVAFDTAGNQYLVSNVFGGAVIAIDSTGTQTEFAAGMGACLGNVIHDGVLYVSGGTHIHGFDLATGDSVWQFTRPLRQSSDGLAVDSSGYLYYVNTSNDCIIRVDIATQAWEELKCGTLTSSPQDIVFDPANNRLLVAAYAPTPPLIAVDLATGDQTNHGTLPASYYDGVAIDEQGGIYYGGGSVNEVLRYPNDFSGRPELLGIGAHWPAGIDINHRDRILSIPCFEADSVAYVDLNAYFRMEYLLTTESSGDSDGHADPGETVTLTPTIRNHRLNAEDATAEITSSDPNLTITTTQVAFAGSVGWGEESTASGGWEVTVDPACPDPHLALLEVTYDYGDGRQTVDSIYLHIGDSYGFEDDFETEVGGWRSYRATLSYADEWHRETYRPFEGSYAMKCGGPADVKHTSHGDGALITPPFVIPPKGVMTVESWLEIENATSSGAWDAASVWIQVDGSSWAILEPEGGYPETTIENYANPLGPGVPCYAGYNNWQQLEFDLSEYSGVARIMFRLTTDAAANGEGWYLDNLSIVKGSCCEIRGDVDNDGAGPNIADLVFMVAYMFDSGPAPVCMAHTDISGDQQPIPDIVDLVVLVNYMFAGGPAPAPCD